MAATVCTLIFSGLSLFAPNAPQNQAFLGGQFVLIDGPSLRKPCVVVMNQTTLKDGKVTTVTIPTAVHYAETVAICNGKDWISTRTGDGILFDPVEHYHYKVLDSHTITVDSDCGIARSNFTYDGEKLMLVNEKTKARRVYRRL